MRDLLKSPFEVFGLILGFAAIIFLFYGGPFLDQPKGFKWSYSLAIVLLVLHLFGIYFYSNSKEKLLRLSQFARGNLHGVFGAVVGIPLIKLFIIKLKYGDVIFYRLLDSLFLLFQTSGT